MYHASAYYGHRCISSRHHCHILARVRFTMVSILTTVGCRIIGEAYHKIPSTLQLWSHDTMITDVPSPLTSRPSGLDNYEFLEVLFTLKLSCISLNNKTFICSFGNSNPCGHGHDRIHAHALTTALTGELWTRTSNVVVNIDILWVITLVMHYFIPALVWNNITKGTIMLIHDWGGGGGDTGVPISHIPKFLTPNIPYPRCVSPPMIVYTIVVLFYWKMWSRNKACNININCYHTY